MSSSFTINFNNEYQKIIKKENLDNYLSKGWSLGQIKLYCKYCNKHADRGNYKMHHGEKCKMRDH